MGFLKSSPARRWASVGMLAGATLVICMGASGGCNGSDVQKAAQAADSIATGLLAAAQANHTAYADGLETLAERQAVASYIDAATSADAALVQQLTALQSGGGKPTAAEVLAAYQALAAKIDQLNSDGLLHLKSASAQAEYTAVMSSIELSLGVLEIETGAAAPELRKARGRRATGTAALVLTAEEVEEIVAIVTAALGVAAPLVLKLRSALGEDTTTLLADATSQNQQAEQVAEQDESAAV